VNTKDETEMKAGNGKKEWKVESGSVFFTRRVSFIVEI
jgi:hypothetical protein